MTQTKRNYKSTLNLPQTDFPMRAGLATNEPATAAAWNDRIDGAPTLFETVEAARAEAPAFIFHDGPPYANGSIHIGHLLNKVLKDLVVRSRIADGFRCTYVPGWDCHGLPIEHRVATELVESGRMKQLETLPDDERRMEVRRACRAYAEKFITLQSSQMKRLLTLADYDHPYLTMDPAFESATLDVFADMVEAGVVYRDLKPVHWSIDNQTALAEAELEYRDREDLSVYVDFRAVDADAVGKAFGVELDARPSFMIWTTTPWTLPANLAIACGERYRYALVRVDGNETILASELVGKVTALAGADVVEVIAECDGRDLVGLEYAHAFCDRTGRVVAADYVTLEDGTGLVHTAPGHGQEDYRTGQREGLEVYCPVRGDGTYDDTVPEWIAGASIWDANETITERLRESGHLFYSHRFMHSYPHDWRSKTPVIFRSTEQWFVGVDRPTSLESADHHGRSLRDLALEQTAEDVRFVPEWGRNRMRGMLESRPDWCLSRQRAWGLPIPAFVRPDGEVLMTPATVRAVAAVVRERGSDAWFTDSPADLLRDWDAAADADAPDGVDVDSLEKMHDIFDVWFESGSSWHSVMRQRGLGHPSDLYLEGSDQHRGWFQLSLLPALGVTGHAPYRTLLTHGFMVDKDGRKMSKSEGNALGVDKLLEEFGADICRWWVSSLAYEGDIKVDLSFFKVASESYRKIRNTLRFLLSNLFDAPRFDAPADRDLASVEPDSIDGWVLARAAALEEAVREAYRSYRFRDAHDALYEFCHHDLSAVYCAAVKDRLYCDAADSPRRRRAQIAMREVLDLLCRLLVPVMPHTAEEAWRALHGDDAACVQVAGPRGLAFTADAGWDTVMETRAHVLKALEEAKERDIENPLDAGVTVPDPDGVLARFAGDLADLFGSSRAAVDPNATAVTIADLREEPRCERCRKRDGTVRERGDGGLLSDRDAAVVGV